MSIREIIELLAKFRHFNQAWFGVPIEFAYFFSKLTRHTSMIDHVNLAVCLLVHPVKRYFISNIDNKNVVNATITTIFAKY